MPLDPWKAAGHITRKGVRGVGWVRGRRNQTNRSTFIRYFGNLSVCGSILKWSEDGRLKDLLH